MGRPRVALRTAAALTATALVTAGCTNTLSSQPNPSRLPAGWPPTLNDLTMGWSAEPGIDVTTWPGVAVRAYTESYLIATIVSDDIYLYPGFAQAVDHNNPLDSPTGSRELWPHAPDPGYPRKPWIGTEQAHILSITSSGNNVTVVTCEYLFGTAEPGRHGDFEDHVAIPPPHEDAIYPMRLTLTAPADPGLLAPPPQQGPARAPSVDVFNGWRITGHMGGYLAEGGSTVDWPTLLEDEDRCIAKAPHIAFSRAAASIPALSSPPFRSRQAGPPNPDRLPSRGSGGRITQRAAIAVNAGVARSPDVARASGNARDFLAAGRRVAVLTFAAPVHPDELSYLNYLVSHGFQYRTNADTPLSKASEIALVGLVRPVRLM